MDWLTDLIKHVSVSKLVAFAFLCTSSFLIFAPIYAPKLIDPLSGFTKTIAWALLVYSASILVVPGLNFIWNTIKNFFSRSLKYWRGRNLTDLERSIIDWAATKGHEPINMSIEMQKMKGIDKIETLTLIKSLASKGFVEVSKNDETIFWLSEKGRTRALLQLKKDKGDHRMHN